MIFVVPSIVGVLMNKIALGISMHANDWTTEKTIIASDCSLQLFQTLETFLEEIFTCVHFVPEQSGSEFESG